MTSDHPIAAPSPVETGGRVDLRRNQCEDDRVSYDAHWLTAAGRWRGRVEVIEQPQLEVHMAVEAGEPPAWLLDFTRSLLRTTAKTKPGAWPRRLSRWRKEPAARKNS